MPYIFNPKIESCEKCDCFERPPQEPSCIQVPVILSQIQIRKCVTRNIALMPAPDNDHPLFTLKGTENFKIIDLRVLTQTSLRTHSDEKRVDLLVVIRYNLIYSDGFNDLVQPDEACFELPIDNINCPDCDVKLFEKDYTGDYSPANRTEKTYFTADALAETFGEVCCSCTGALIIDLGVFFIIKSKCNMQLSVPSFSVPIPLS